MTKFSWQTAEYVHFEKSNDWFWTVGIITAALVVTAIIFGDPLFGIVLAIGAFTLALFASRKPRTISVDITDKGIAIDKTFFPFANLESFSVDTVHHHGPRLVLKSKKKVVPLVTVPIQHNNPEELHDYLETHLKPETFDQNLMHIVFEKMGF
jgi:Co/Zn/Cd efflux system component